MPFQKGHKKIGGRKPETPNKVKKDLRTRISMFLEDNFDEAIDTWKGIKEPKEKVSSTQQLPKKTAWRMTSKNCRKRINSHTTFILLPPSIIFHS